MPDYVTREEFEAREEEFDWDELINSTEDLYGYKARVDQSEEDDREMPMPARVSIWPIASAILASFG